MQTVEMDMAFSFVCPECGHRTYVDAVTAEFTPQEADDIADEFGFDEPPRTGEWATYPSDVECEKCQAEFSTGVE